MNAKYKELLDKGAHINVVIPDGKKGCSDARDACLQYGHLVLYRKNDDYLIDTPDGDNIVWVDSWDYISMIAVPESA